MAEISENGVREELIMENEAFDLYWCYLVTHNLDELNQAVFCAREDLALTPSLMPDIVHLGRTLLRRFQHTRRVEDLTEAIENLLFTLQDFGDDRGTLYQQCLDLLSISYLERDGNLDVLLELNVPHAYTDLSPSLEALTQKLGEDADVYFYLARKQSGTAYVKLKDLDNEVHIRRLALGFFAPHSVYHFATTCLLSNDLTARFRELGKVEDINEATDLCFIDLKRDLKRELPSCVKIWLQSNATQACFGRFEALERPEDLDNAVLIAAMAADPSEKDEIVLMRRLEFELRLEWLSKVLSIRYHYTGDVNDLNVAIDASSRAVNLAEDETDAFQQSLLRLQRCLITRLRRSGRDEDLTEVIMIGRRAVDCLSPEDPRRLNTLIELMLLEMEPDFIMQTDSATRRASQYFLQALENRMLQQYFGLHWTNQEVNPKMLEHIDTHVLNGLAQFLCFGLSGTPCDALKMSGTTQRIQLDAVISLARIGASRTNDLESMDSHVQLAQGLWVLWTSTHDVSYLDERISALRRAINAAAHLGEVHPGCAYCNLHIRAILGESLYDRFKITGEDDSLDEAVSILLEGFWMSGPIQKRMQSGLLVIDILSDKADWDSTRKLLPEIIDLFMILNDRSQAWENKESMLRECCDGAAKLASIALETGISVGVINLLEVCRGSIFGHLLERQADLEELMGADPEKAERFKNLQNEINTVTHPCTDMGIRVRQTLARIDAETEIRALLAEIRKLPGFDRFLLGPTETELKAAAARGPIIIVNVTKLRSDAVIITKECFQLLPLQALKCEEVQKYIDLKLTEFGLENSGRKNKIYQQLHEWLWETCVQLILRKLEDLGYGPAKFHVWWMGVGVGQLSTVSCSWQI